MKIVNNKLAHRKLSHPMKKKLEKIVSALEQSTSLADMPYGRPHLLNRGKLYGYFAITLGSGVRLLILPLDEHGHLVFKKWQVKSIVIDRISFDHYKNICSLS